MHVYAYMMGVVEWQERWSPRTMHQTKLSMGFCQNFDNITIVFWLKKTQKPAKKRTKEPLIFQDPLTKGCSVIDLALSLIVLY